MDKNIVSTNQDAKLILSKSRSLLNITNKLFERKKNDWIERLFVWADKNKIPNYEWINDNDFDEGGYYNGIPRDKDKLLNLKILRLHDLNIIKLPSELFCLIQLEELKISNSNLQLLSNDIKNLINLKNLSLTNNNLSILPEGVKYLINLKKIHLHTNNFNSFPEILYNLTFLEHICISINKPCKLSSNIKNLINLNSFEIDNIINIPEEMKNLENLTELKISENNLGNFPNGMNYLVNIKKLFIKGKCSSFLPIEILNLPKLSTLFISDTDKIKVSKEIKNLEYLYFVNCNDIIFELKTNDYKNLILNGFAIINSEIKSIPDFIINTKINQVILKNVPKLTLSNEQKQWIFHLIDKQANIDLDDNLLDINVDEIPL